MYVFILKLLTLKIEKITYLKILNIWIKKNHMQSFDINFLILIYIYIYSKIIKNIKKFIDSYL